MKHFYSGWGIACLTIFLASITNSANAQTRNGKPLRSYDLCLELTPTSFDDDCLGNGIRDNDQMTAEAWVTNTCDEELTIEYAFDGRFIDADNNPIKSKTRKEYLKPGKRQRIYFCETANNSGSIYILNIQPKGGRRSSRGGSGFSSGTGSTGASSGNSSYSGTYSGSAPSSGASSNSASTNNERSVDGMAGYEEYKRKNKPGESSSASKSSLEKEQEREDFHRKHVESTKSGSGTNSGSGAEANSSSGTEESSSSNTAENQSSGKSVAEEAGRREYQQEVQRIRQEEARKQQEIRQNQQRYDQLKQQSYDNMEDAAALSAAAILVHLYIGKLIYQIQDNSYNTVYKDWAPHTHLSFGYGLSIHSLQTRFSSLERNSGSSSGGSRITNRPTIDLSLNFDHWSLKSSNFGIGYHLGISAGHGFLFETFKARTDVGIKTRLGPLVFNTFSEFGTLKFATWIDPTEVADEKLSYVNGRVETGFRFGKNGQDHNLLFVMQRPMRSMPDDQQQLGYGGKYEGGNSNGMRFIAEFVSLPAAYGASSLPSDEDAGMPFQLNLAVHNALDWYHKSYHNTYDKRVLYKANRNKTWFLNTNAKITYGDIYSEADNKEGNFYERSRPALEFQLLVEKNIHLKDGLFANIGGGATLIRRFDGNLNGTMELPGYEGSVSSNLSAGKFTVDLPVGLVYTFEPKTKDDWAPWLAFNTEMVINAGNALEIAYLNDEGRQPLGSAHAEALDAEQKTFYTMLQFGTGLDYFYGLNKRLRWGIYYQFAPASLYETWYYKPHGLVLSLKHSL